MLNIVLDTNVIVSALLNPSGVPGEILEWVLDGDVRAIIDNRILSEYTEVLKRPGFSFAAPRISEILDALSCYAKSVEAKPIGFHLQDVSDEPFLESAVTGNADYLITGNLRHFPQDKRHGIKVITPREFMEIFYNRNMV